MRWVIALAALWPAFLQAADEPSLLLLSQGKSLRLQLVIRVGGQPAETAHDAFLDRLFNFFDRDADGFLSAEEAQRLFPLPNADGRGIAMNFKKLDTNGDGKGSRGEFKAFYRQAGFTSIVAIFAPAGAEMTRANAVLFERLDRDGDGKLSRAELEQAPALLRSFDIDEDEVLTVAELLATGANPGDTDIVPAVSWSVAAAKQPPDGVLSISAGKVELRDVVGMTFEKVAADIRFSGDTLRVNSLAGDPKARFKGSREFYLAPFKSALGDKPSLEKKAIDNDSSLAFLAPLLPFADRDSDGRLSLAELETFLDLIDAGASSQIVVRIADEGASLLGALDENQDGRLDLSELSRAARLLPKGRETLTRQEIPHRLTIVIEQGSPGKTFGPVLLVGKSTVPVEKKTATPTGPKWFQAMDRNGDGKLSRREFLGPPELFAELDTDRDGFISIEEAMSSKP